MTKQVRPWVVTGAAGFIGFHLARTIAARGHPVRVVDNLLTGRRENLDALAATCEIIEGDLRDGRVCARAAADAEVVFHLAALGSVPRSLSDPSATHDHNVNATVALLEASRAAGVGRFVYSSSSSVYGDTPVLPKSESQEPLPRSPYAASKLSGEQYVLAYARAGLLEGTALRYFNVFGPHQRPDAAYAAVIPLLFRAAVTGDPATLFGDGRQTRDFTYVANVVDANLLAATRPAAAVSGCPFNVGAGHQTPLLELVTMIQEVTGKPIALTRAAPRPGDVRDSLASLNQAAALLGYRPAVPLREGLQRTWEWFQRAFVPETES